MVDFTASGNKIRGGIPQSFFTLIRLQFLNLHNNQLTLTPEITNANSIISVLSLGNNLFEGTIPESLSLLYGLVKLNLGHNMLDGTIPRSFYLLTNLESLKLESNMLTGTIPALNQTRLTSVDLSQNYLTMGSLREVPLSTFSPNALAMDVNLQSNCLVFSNPSKPSQNVTATHCGGEQVCQSSYCLLHNHNLFDLNMSLSIRVGPTARPTSKPTAPTAAPTSSAADIRQAAAAMAEGLELFAMAKAIPSLQIDNFSTYAELCVYFHYFICH